MDTNETIEIIKTVNGFIVMPFRSHPSPIQQPDFQREVYCFEDFNGLVRFLATHFKDKKEE